MQIYSVRLVMLCICISSFIGCVRRSSYTRYQLAPLTEQSAEYSDTQDGLTLHAHCYTVKERNRLFNKRGRYLKGMQPVQLSIHNDTDFDWQVVPESISIPLIDAARVIKELKFWSGWRTIGIISGGLIVGTALAATGFGLIALWGGVGGSLAMVSVGYLAYAGAGYFFIMTPVSTYSTACSDAIANRYMYDDVHELLCAEAITLPAHAALDILLFTDATTWKGTCLITFSSADRSSKFFMQFP